MKKRTHKKRKEELELVGGGEIFNIGALIVGLLAIWFLFSFVSLGDHYFGDNGGVGEATKTIYERFTGRVVDEEVVSDSSEDSGAQEEVVSEPEAEPVEEVEEVVEEVASGSGGGGGAEVVEEVDNLPSEESEVGSEEYASLGDENATSPSSEESGVGSEENASLGGVENESVEVPEVVVNESGVVVVEEEEGSGGGVSEVENVSVEENVTVVLNETTNCTDCTNVTVEENETVGINLTEILNETNETIVLNETNFSEVNLSAINVSDVSTLQYKAVIGRPVKWVKKVNVTNKTNISIEIPKEAENISVLTNGEVEEAEERARDYEKVVNESDREELSRNSVITGNVVFDIREGQGIFTRFWNWLTSFTLTGNVVLEEDLVGEIAQTDNATVVDLNGVVNETGAEVVAVEYETPAPIANESYLENGKRIVVSAPSEYNYTEILAYSLVEDWVEMSDDSLRLYWYEEDELVVGSNASLVVGSKDLVEEVGEKLVNGSEGVRRSVEFVKYDFDGDGFVDYVEWVVPHLSAQVYELIYIVKAERLDENRTSVEDVYEFVKELDNSSIYIADGEYLRVTFEMELDSTKDITLFVATNNESVVDSNASLVVGSKIEVYEEDSDVLIVSFENLSIGRNQVLLTNFSGVNDVFDLRVVSPLDTGDQTGQGIWVDYVVDPVIVEGNCSAWDGVLENLTCTNDVLNLSGTNTSGVYTSGVIDAGSLSSWINISWEGDTLSGYSSNLCTGGVAYASDSYSGSYSAAQAFDQNNDSYWLSVTANPHWLKYDFGEGNEKTVTRYGILTTFDSNYVYVPENWTFEGSNDNFTSWDVLDTRTSVAWSSSSEYQSFDVDNSVAYRYYRINVTNAQFGSGAGLAELEMFENQALGSLNFSVRSCDDIACSGESWIDIADSSPQVLGLTQNQYFQYKTGFDILSGAASPKLYNVSIEYNISDSVGPTLEFVSPTPNNSEKVERDYVYVNVTSSDDSEHSVFLDWNRSLVGWWGFDSCNASGCFDNSSYGNFGVFNGGLGESDLVSGKRGNGLEFDGVDDWVEVSDDDTLNEKITISAWINRFGATTCPRIVAKSYNSKLTGSSCFQLDITCSGDKTRFAIGGVFDLSDGVGPELELNTWYHLVGIYDSSNSDARVYVDGVEVWNSSSYNSSIKTNSSEPISIGATVYGGARDYEFNGSIDEVMILNRTLSADEVKAVYDAGSYRLETNLTNLSEGVYDYSVYGIDSLGNVNSSSRDVLVSQDVPLVEFGEDAPSDGSVLSADNFVVDLNVTDSSLGYSFVDFDESLVGYWRGEDEARDESDEFLSLDGDGDYVNVSYNASFDMSDELTIGAWVKPGPVSGYSTNFRTILAKGPHVRDYELAWDSSQGELECVFETSDSFNRVTVSYPYSDQIGNWNYVVCTYKEGIDEEAKIYANGVLLGGSNITATITPSVNDVTIGWDGDAVSDRYFNGSIDNVIVLNRSLSASEIGDLYSQGRRYSGFSDDSLVAKWDFDGDVNDSLGVNDGTLVGNASIVGMNDGTLVGDVSIGSGKFGRGFEFDGDGDWVDCGNESTMNANEMGISLWIKTPGSGNGGIYPYYGIISKYSSTGGYDWDLIISNSTGLLRMAVRGNSNIDTSNFGGNLFDNSWHHIFVNANSSSVNVFIDGILNKTTTGTWTPNWGTEAIKIGTRNGYDFNGSIDEVMIFNRTLLVDEVMSLYNSSVYSHNFSSLSSGVYSVQGVAVDSVGNKGSSFERLISVAASCSCSSLQAGEAFDASSGCNILTCDLGGQPLRSTGSGEVWVTGNLTNVGGFDLSSGCYVNLGDGVGVSFA